MRYFILISFFFLASCATPQSEPQSFYGQVYAPGNVTIDGSGVFTSTAKVNSGEFIREARMAAYLRLMESAVIAGYKSVSINHEEVTDFIGYKISIRGRLYLFDEPGENIYPISSISRILRGLPLKKLNAVAVIAPKPVKKRKLKPKLKSKSKPKPTKVKKTKPKKSKKPKKKVVKTQPKPVALPEPTSVADDVIEDIGAPTVIMAPEDITGSVLKSANDNTVLNGDLKIKSATKISPNAIAIPKALTGTPLGVVIRKK